MIKIILLISISFIYSIDTAQKASIEQRYKLIAGSSIIQSKNYYLLTLFQEIPGVRKLLEADPVLLPIVKNKLQSLSLSLKDCNTNAQCFTERMKYSEKEIKDISDRLAKLYTNENALGKLVTQHLIPSGTYARFNNLTPKDLLIKAWQQDAYGINFTIGVYGEGKKANYPNIDSISFNVSDSRYSNLVYSFAYSLINDCRDSALFFIPSLTAALRFLEINERDNAQDYEPMAATVNKAAFERVKQIKWDRYKYSVILIPGAGPNDPTVELSAEAMLRMRMAALQYTKGLAPFLVVSGGKVHPYKTKFCEAEKMKAFLMQKLHVPENAIIMDPHARHTTTNLRNCARLIFRYGMPFDKPSITSTSRGQSNMITTTLAERCLKELQEIPFKNGARLSETEAEFYPQTDALHINPTEPMDP